MIDIYTYKHGETIRHSSDPGELPALIADPDRITWLDLEDPHEDETVLLESVFHFHVLAIEDCIHGRSFPKIDVFEDCLFLVAHGIVLDRGKRDFANDPVNMFLGRNFLVTYHNEPLKSLRATKALLAKSDAPIARGPDFLMHTILDLLVDDYQPILDEMDQIVDAIEARIIEKPDESILQDILGFKRTMQRLRRIASYQKEILNRLSREEFRVIDTKLHIYFRDVFDHLVRVTDLAESYKEVLASALEAYLTVVSNRLNEVMKVLTIFSTILMPLTLIASILGMNLAFPFRADAHTFRVTMTVMVLIGVVMLIYFRRRRWV